MSAFLQQLTTIITIFTTDWFNTNNRVLDSTLVAMTVGAITFYMNHLQKHWARYWNQWVYWWYDMKHHPYELDRAPYIIPHKFTAEMDNEMSIAFSFYLSYSHSRENRLEGYKISLTNYYSYIEKHIRQVRTQFMKKENGREFEMQTLKHLPHTTTFIAKGLYPLFVTRDGHIVYYSTAQIIVSLSYSAVAHEDICLDKLVEKMYHEEETKNGSTKGELKIFAPAMTDQKAVTGVKQLGIISSKKTFQNLFFEQKPALMNLIHKFKEKTLYPPHVSMDTKLGILLYGPPGTGKTGTISAIANELKRNIITINFAEIRLCKEFDAIMDPIKNPYKDYLFVFDELDCILNALGEQKRDQAPSSDWGAMLLAAEGEERKNIIEMMRSERQNKPDATIDMAYLLQKLDGLVSAEDRVILATTNNPDKINPALLRPGRFDIKLCLGNCSHKMVADILEYYYGESSATGADTGGVNVREVIMRIPIPDGAISPLELINRAMQAPSFAALVKELKTWKRQLAAAGGA